MFPTFQPSRFSSRDGRLSDWINQQHKINGDDVWIQFHQCRLFLKSRSFEPPSITCVDAGLSVAYIFPTNHKQLRWHTNSTMNLWQESRGCGSHSWHASVECARMQLMQLASNSQPLAWLWRQYETMIWFSYYILYIAMTKDVPIPTPCCWLFFLSHSYPKSTHNIH